MERNNEFAPQESMIRNIEERLAEGDIVTTTLESLIDQMNELAEKRDGARNIKVAENIGDVLDQARIKTELLLLQMSGILDNARAKPVSDEDIKGILTEVSNIEGLLNSAEESGIDNEKIAA